MSNANSEIYAEAVLVSTEAGTALASLGQIRSAASTLILQCAAGGESQGGIARNIGEQTPSCEQLNRAKKLLQRSLART